MQREATLAQALRAREKRVLETERNRDTPHSARAHCRGLSRVFEQARQRNQAARRRQSRLSQARERNERCRTPPTSLQLLVTRSSCARPSRAGERTSIRAIALPSRRN